MSSNGNSSESSKSKAISRRLKGAIEKVIYEAAKPKQRSGNPHWRRSANVVLSNARRHVPTPYVQSRAQGIFVTLPTELRQCIEDHLPEVDLVCLQQTCDRFRHESQVRIAARDLDHRRLHSLRKRLDRDALCRLSTLERNSQLGDRFAVCSFCCNVHSRKKFTPEQLRTDSRTRVCSAALRRYLVLGFHWTYPSVLRQTLDDLIATGRDLSTDHHTMPLESISPKASQRHQILSRVIECDKSTPASRARLFIDSTGLVLEHNFYLQSQQLLGVLDWNIPLILNNPYKSVLAVCPHLNLRMAAGSLQVGNDYNGQCTRNGCRTRFGWFESSGEGAVGWYDLCLRVERRFGWVENLSDRFWQGQAE